MINVEVEFETPSGRLMKGTIKDKVSLYDPKEEGMATHYLVEIDNGVLVCIKVKQLKRII